MVYGFAAASKINGDFLSGRVIAENLHPAFGVPAAGPLPASLAVAAIVIEVFVAWSLLRHKWRTAGAIVGLALHIAFVLAITQTIAMIAFAVMCLSIYPLAFTTAEV